MQMILITVFSLQRRILPPFAIILLLFSSKSPSKEYRTFFEGFDVVNCGDGVLDSLNGTESSNPVLLDYALCKPFPRDKPNSYHENEEGESLDDVTYERGGEDEEEHIYDYNGSDYDAYGEEENNYEDSFDLEEETYEGHEEDEEIEIYDSYDQEGEDAEEGYDLDDETNEQGEEEDSYDLEQEAYENYSESEDEDQDENEYWDSSDEDYFDSNHNCAANGTCTHDMSPNTLLHNDEEGYSIYQLVYLFASVEKAADENIKDRCSDGGDEKPECYDWAKEGECTENTDYMIQYCPKSCNICRDGYVIKFPWIDMEGYSLFRKSEIQYLPAMTKEREKVRKIIQGTVLYLSEIVRFLGPEKLYSCLDLKEECAYWASNGECMDNPDFMLLQCPQSCRSCEKLDASVRCPIKETATPAYENGEMNAMFQQIANGKLNKYNPNILFRPIGNHENDDEKDEFPWIITFDDFLTEEECEILIAHGNEIGYERSLNAEEELADGTFSDGVDEERTSVNSWCEDNCHNDPRVQSIYRKIEEITGVSEAHFEHLQILRYEEGQFYGEHHDYMSYQTRKPCGPRILTFFMYLSDVELGGGTNFPTLELEVKPKRGKALLWPNVADGQWDEAHWWTDHEALPVERGLKYAANAWIHLYNFKEPHRNGCS